MLKSEEVLFESEQKSIKNKEQDYSQTTVFVYVMFFGTPID